MMVDLAHVAVQFIKPLSHLTLETTTSVKQEQFQLQTIVRSIQMIPSGMDRGVVPVTVVNVP